MCDGDSNLEVVNNLNVQHYGKPVHCTSGSLCMNIVIWLTLEQNDITAAFFVSRKVRVGLHLMVILARI
jgi:hypothetical protein